MSPPLSCLDPCLSPGNLLVVSQLHNMRMADLSELCLGRREDTLFFPATCFSILLLQDRERSIADNNHTTPTDSISH